jgi:preprotein translocase subunit SecD
MSSDYIPRLRQELLRAGATQPSRFRRPRPARALRPLAAVAAVALVVVAVALAFPLGGEQPGEPAADTVELTYRVDPSDAASAAKVMRERLATAGVRDARVSAAGGTLTITAPASARADVAALTAPGRFALYDWEASVLGPRGVPAPGDAKVTGGQDAGHAPAISKAEAAARGGQVVRALGGASDGWFALGGTPALTNADLERVRADVFDVRTGDPIVAIDMTPSGQRAFAELTRRIAERGTANATPGSGLESVQHFVIVVDDRVAAVPFIDFRQNPEGIDGASGMQISGDLTRESARQLAALLSAGPLPASFEPAGQAP